MPVEADVIYRTKDQIVADLITAMMAQIPDVWIEEDGNVRIFWEVLAGSLEGIYLANQIVRDNIFVQTANFVELRRHGEEFGVYVKVGTPATGTVKFSGSGGTTITAGAEISSDPGAGDLLYYQTTADATIPNPGAPSAPTIADGGAGNPLAGTYEYVITFTTAGGETAAGDESDPLTTTAAHQINLTAIPLGGPGTTGRKIYRQRDGGGYKFVHTLADNTTTTYTDNVLEASLGSAPPAESTAESVETTASSEDNGEQYNAVIGAINEIIDVPDGVTDVTNTTIFTGGSDTEDMEAFRARLLEFLRNPQTGSVADLEAWAKEIDGVDEATAFENENLGVAQNGHVTIRISGPNGSIPDAGVVAAVQASVVEKDIANITIHTTTFTAVPTNVTVTVTPATGYVLADVTNAVQSAIEDYINSVRVGGTVYKAGVIDAVFGLAGVANVTTTFTDTTHTSTEKATVGTIVVS